MRQSPPSPEAAELGRQIRMHRTARGRRQRAVAAEAGMDPGVLSRVETGEAGDVSVSTLARVARVLGLELKLATREEVASDGTDRAA